MRMGAAWLLSIALTPLAWVAQGADDLSKGTADFRHCAACHSAAKGEHLTGPGLQAAGEKAALDVIDRLRPLFAPAQ